MELTERRRNRLATAGAVMAALALVITTVWVWAERYPLDPDRFAAATAVALDDPEVVEALAVVVTDQTVDLILAVFDPRQLLPGPLQNLGGGVERWLREQVADGVAWVVGTDRVSGLMVEAVRVAHDDVLTLMEKGRTDDGILVTGMGTVRLDLTALLAAGLDALADRSWLPASFGGLQDTLRGGLDGLRERIFNLTGVDIGADIGTIEVYDEVAVGGGGLALRSARALPASAVPGWLVPVVGIVAAVAAVAVGGDMRRPVVTFGVALVASAAVAALYLWRLGIDIENLLVDPAARRAASTIVDELVRPLRFWLAALAVVGAGLALVVRQATSPLLTTRSAT